MKCESQPDDRSSGFVLLEALATLAISAFLLVALASVTNLTFRAYQGAQRVSDTMELQDRTLAALARDISVLQRVRWAGPDPAFVFSGRPDVLIFAYAVPSAAGERTMHVVTLRATQAGTHFVLGRSEGALVQGSRRLEEIAFSEPVTIFAGVRAVRFAYYGELPDGREALMDSWQDPGQLPVAIRVLIGGVGDESTAAALRIPLMLQAEPSCAIPDDENCSFARETAQATPASAGTGERVDPDDPLGWMRYAK